MTDDIAAVPAAVSTGYGEAVSDEEFETWVKRSQADTEAAIAEWDTSVEFDMIRNGGPPEDVVVDGDVECGDPTCGCHRWPELQRRILAGEELGPDIRAWVEQQERMRFPILREAIERDLRVRAAQLNLEAQGIVVVERQAMPGLAEELGLILPGRRDVDGLEQRIRRELGVQ